VRGYFLTFQISVEKDKSGLGSIARTNVIMHFMPIADAQVPLVILQNKCSIVLKNSLVQLDDFPLLYASVRNNGEPSSIRFAWLGFY
jgi:hypothetical protein